MTLNEKIIDMFLKEKSVSEISILTNLSSDEIISIIKEAKIHRRYTNLSEVLCQKIIKKYNSGMTANEIGKDYVMSHHSVAKLLIAHGMTPRSKTGKRIYSLDENYFDIIDTPNKAYILGFLYADGYNSIDKSTVSIALQEEDKDILESMRNEIKSENKLKFLDYSDKHDGGYTYKNQYKLTLNSIHMCRTLNSIGMTPNKSLTLVYPEIPQELNSHFIRGYFDGDGCVMHDKKYGNYAVTILGTETFCKSIQEIISREVGVNSYIYDASNHNGITKYIGVYGRKQVISFLTYLYNNAELFLERKNQKFQECLIA